MKIKEFLELLDETNKTPYFDIEDFERDLLNRIIIRKRRKTPFFRAEI